MFWLESSIKGRVIMQRLKPSRLDYLLGKSFPRKTVLLVAILMWIALIANTLAPWLRQQYLYFCTLSGTGPETVYTHSYSNRHAHDSAPGNRHAHPSSGPGSTFAVEADANARESSPTTNFGLDSTLLVDSGTGVNVESYLRFTVSGVSGPVQSAKLRLYVDGNGSANAPAVYATGNTWTETGLTWNNRPAPTSGVLDDKGALAANVWAEYNVTALVTGNGTYSFRLLTDSTDGIVFSSRQGSFPPQLVITTGTGPTATPTAVPPATATPTDSAPGDRHAHDSAPSDRHAHDGPATATPTPSSGPGSTFAVEADANARESSPTTNFGLDSTLLVDSGTGVNVESYPRFTVSGVSGPVQSAKLRLYVDGNGSANAPAVYATGNTWTETGLTWNNRPAPTSGVLDDKGALAANVWAEYNVTALVTGNGTYSFRLLTDSTDGIVFSSRQGSFPPQLVITTGTGPTATPTAVPPATATPTTVPGGDAVLIGAGDIAGCSDNNDEATAKLLDATSGTVFTAGDNVYDSGTYTEYVNCYEPTWGRHKARTKPSPGNHEYLTSGAAGYFQYWNNIPACYAYDLGAWRIYALNSEISVSSSSPQVVWLKNDLAANPRACVLAYWHKPRWSSGTTHGPATSMQALWDVLYAANADIVVNGHEHNYERFALQNPSGQLDTTRGLREFRRGHWRKNLVPGFLTPAQQPGSQRYQLWRAQTHPTRQPLRLAVPPRVRSNLFRQRQHHLPLG